MVFAGHPISSLLRVRKLTSQICNFCICVVISWHGKEGSFFFQLSRTVTYALWISRARRWYRSSCKSFVSRTGSEAFENRRPLSTPCFTLSLFIALYEDQNHRLCVLPMRGTQRNWKHQKSCLCIGICQVIMISSHYVYYHERIEETA